MKKLIYTLLLLGLVTSCASHPGRVCGGRGGGRVVKHSPTEKTMYKKPIV
jgi:hypothetical protein